MMLVTEKPPSVYLLSTSIQNALSVGLSHRIRE